MFGKLLKQFTLDTGVSQKEIAERLKFSPQRVNNYFRDAADPPREFLEKFRSEFQVDLKKLADRDKKTTTSPTASYNPIPVYDLELKPMSDPNFFNHNELIAYYIDAPIFNDCFAAVKVVGNAMSPAFNPADLVAIRKVKVDSAIPYGEPFLIVTEDQNFLRYIRLNEKDPSKTFLLRSENPEANDDIIVKKSDVKHLFQIKGKMSRR